MNEEIYRLMDSFLTESTDQNGKPRSIERLNKDRHLFVENMIYYINKLLDENRENLVKETREYLKVYLNGKLMCTCEDCNKIRDDIKKSINI
jgi:hypothetical protein